ncbi:nuclear transport factor 2 family protein [Phenylobacterium sp.]|jgi:ketosteroid isomerase-like protein|uniref:nuclear transport factor 2 family protein n=1 Tax=Phenylobacterium sp. TaxID=1871053 RepID=UPI0037C53478
MTAQDYLDFGARYMAAVQAGDTEAVRACYAPDAKLWHNTDGIEQTVEENMKLLGWMIRMIPDRNYRILRREALADGFVQQHVLEASLPNGGGPWTMDACAVVRVQDGVITRLDEYVDSAQFKILLDARRKP